ncbi:Uncharacterised ACR, YkgG family COG1556 [Cruoricaptor ignavus]|uniref:LUD domain-containing protein n=1 Tax=Cruoricaptor ignavus TaxID=1118202 RepID=A0A1M6AW91_9FLAO|nr:LUD domain-containing protein [Cruoricaptor ignavus]QOR73106.1 LUD domain-containing protein [Cruoricaptor ignavus]SHI40722.1 Uncharacterised ACR, YkgG family COG1556 [Cruoricaptor ignavus]
MSIFKKIIKKIVPQQEPADERNVARLADQLKNADPDYRFAQLFTHDGGFFNYCGDEAEALQTLNQIIKIEEIQSVYCFDEDLKNFLSVINVKYTPVLELFNDAAFITCEYLMADSGRIMLTSNNIQHYPSSRLPDKIIIMATVSQIVTNLNEAMMKVKRQGTCKNLTSISCGKGQLETMEKANTKIFLLLLED